MRLIYLLIFLLLSCASFGQKYPKLEEVRTHLTGAWKSSTKHRKEKVIWNYSMHSDSTGSRSSKYIRSSAPLFVLREVNGIRRIYSIELLDGESGYTEIYYINSKKMILRNVETGRKYRFRKQ